MEMEKIKIIRINTMGRDAHMNIGNIRQGFFSTQNPHILNKYRMDWS